MDRVFLDANVLFSAAYRAHAGLRKLWSLPGVELITSTLAREEARRNLPEPDQQKRLDRLLASVTVVPDAPDYPVPRFVDLPDKDCPILQAALAARTTHLLTGDWTHFGRYYGKAMEGLLILPPASYLRSRLR